MPEIFGFFKSAWDNALASMRENKARQENYMYNEMSAMNADQRTRALYNDLYSPGAQLSQIKEAGLSPSLFYGDGGGIAGQSGAQGAGATGISPNIFGVDPLAGAQIELLKAQAQNTKANTQKINSETTGIDLQNAWQKMENLYKKADLETEFLYFIDKEGKEQSVFDIAKTCNNYHDFIKAIEEYTENMNHESEEYQILKPYIHTARGDEKLRQIYLEVQRFETNIDILKHNSTGAKFEKSLIDALLTQTDDNGQKIDFAKLNAKSTIASLKASAATNDLTKEQKEAWNNIIDKLEKKNSDLKDILIVVAMIVNNAMSNYHYSVSASYKAQ